jgi:hypothetical protein
MQGMLVFHPEYPAVGEIFSPPSPSLPPATPPVPTVDDPAVEEARRKQRLVEARRRGRQAAILNGGAGNESAATANRPGLRRLLGGG